jgi:filamentous hemagglutinin family protein
MPLACTRHKIRLRLCDSQHNLILYGMLASSAVAAAGPAGIKLDGTLGPSAAALTGPMYAITQNFGKLAGGNLYFSFQYFNVATGETALFSTTSAGINNVISRVTGGYASTIDGTIQLQAASGAPNLFLINPSGVTFTANAVIDVPAAFYVSTANYLKFSDGNFYVDPGKMSTLSAAAPEAFGFLGTTRAPVNIEGATLSAGVNGAGDFQIAAGDVTIDGQGGYTDANGVLEPQGISNTTGNIRVTAIGSASGEVPLSGPFAATDGTVTIRNGGILLTQGQGASAGGSIEVNAGSLLIDGAGVTFYGDFQTGIITSTDVLGAGSDSAGSITVTVGNAAKLVNLGEIDSQTFGSGNAGNISLSAHNLTIDNANNSNAYDSSSNTSIGTVTLSSGRAGDVAVNVRGAVSIVNGGEIESLSFGAGNAGNISLSANSLMIDSGTTPPYFGSGTTIGDAPYSSGSGGNIIVNVTGNISILNFGGIYANADGPTGNAGNITLNSGSLTMNGGTAFLAGGLFTGPYFNEGPTGSEFSSGSGGNIIVNVTGNVLIENGDQIFSGTYGPGNAGNISISAAKLTIDQTVPFVQIPGPLFFNVPVTGLFADTFGAGSAGQINLKLGSLAISGESASDFVGISSSDGNPISEMIYGVSAGSGSSGSIVANITGSATLQDGGQMSTATYGSGYAGDMRLTAGSLVIGGGPNPSAISSQAQLGSGGQAGQVTINAGLLDLESNGSIDISNDATVSNPHVITPTEIKINAQEIDMDGGQITAASTGNLAASSIDINYGSGLHMDPSTISTSAVDGNGGPITISGQGPLFINHSNITTSVSGVTNGNGGDISINVPLIVIDTGAIQANTLAPLASGGTVSIDAQALVPSYQSFILGGSAVAFDPTAIGLNVVQAAAPDGLSGVLSVTVPTLELGNALLGLTGRPSAPPTLSHDICGSSRASSLAVAGRGGVAPTAYDPLGSDAIERARESSIHGADPAWIASDEPRVGFVDRIACR